MTTVQESAVYKLAGALLGDEWDDATGKSGKRNHTDLGRQTAGSVGVRLQNNTRDPRILKLLSDVREYVQGAFRQEFEAALEQEITCLQETGLTSGQFGTALTYAKRLVNNRMRQGVKIAGTEGLTTPYCLLGGLDSAERQDGHIEIDIGICGLVGAKRFDPGKKRYHTRPGSLDDAKQVARALQGTMSVDIEPSLGLQARRLGRPSVNELHQPTRLPGGGTFFHAYGVQIGYRASIPIGMMPALYEQSQKAPVG